MSLGRRRKPRAGVAKLPNPPFVRPLRGFDSLPRLTVVDLAELGDDDPLRYGRDRATGPRLPRSPPDERTWTALEHAERSASAPRPCWRSATEVAD